MSENNIKNTSSLPTPCYVIDEKALIGNLEKLRYVEQKTGCHVLLAQKAFSAYHVYPLISEYISGTTSSGIFEARLAHEEMGNKQIHVYAPAFKDDDMDELLKICGHIVFNSFSQWKHFRKKALAHKNVEFGLRVNPEYSEIETDIYNPCFTNSRLGITLENFEENELDYEPSECILRSWGNVRPRKKRRSTHSSSSYRTMPAKSVGTSCLSV